MLTYPDKTVKVQNITAEERKKQERMRDVLLLLQHLVEKEETTLKLLIDCLYDVGSVNLVNQRIRHRRLKGLMKAIAIMSKPVFRIIMLRWVKKNVPLLVTNWLERKVSFR
jgi:hypothetical protein